VPQSVNPARFLNPGTPLRGAIRALQCGRMHRLCGPLRGNSHGRGRAGQMRRSAASNRADSTVCGLGPLPCSTGSSSARIDIGDAEMQNLIEP
jgi:hypothetical protein